MARVKNFLFAGLGAAVVYLFSYTPMAAAWLIMARDNGLFPHEEEAPEWFKPEVVASGLVLVAFFLIALARWITRQSDVKSALTSGPELTKEQLDEYMFGLKRFMAVGGYPSLPLVNSAGQPFDPQPVSPTTGSPYNSSAGTAGASLVHRQMELNRVKEQLKAAEQVMATVAVKISKLSPAVNEDEHRLNHLRHVAETSQREHRDWSDNPARKARAAELQAVRKESAEVQAEVSRLRTELEALGLR